MPEVQCVAMNGLTDILITHGELRLSESQESGLGISIEEFVQGLNLYIFHSNEALQNVACECYCKLFIFDKIRSILCLSNLLLLFLLPFFFIIFRLFDSATHRFKLHQILSVFFPSFCSPEIDRNCLFLEEAVVFTLKGIAEAGIPDRYSMISKIGQFFILLMTMDLRQSEKRHFIASSDEEPNDASNGEEAKGGSEKERSKEYHRCVMVLVEKIVELCDSKYGFIFGGVV